MADLLDSIQRELRERLDELRPLVVEYERLQAAEQALGERSQDASAGSARPARGQRRGRRRPAARRAATGTRASRAANREKLLELVGERPGITKAELKDATGLSSAGVAQNLRRVVASGQVREEPLPGDQVGYRLGDGGDAGGGDPPSEGAAAQSDNGTSESTASG